MTTSAYTKGDFVQIQDDPEVLFHVTLTSGQTKYKDRGKLALHWLPQEMADACTKLRSDINTLQTSIANLFTTHHGMEPKLYFDFLDSSDVNALAFTDGSWSFIGLTGGFPEQTMAKVEKLTGCPSFPEWLAIKTEHYQSKRHAVSESLFRLVLSFVWAHELGHHISGHIPLEAARHVRFEAMDCLKEGSLRRQAEELDAVKHGIETLLNQLKRDLGAFFDGKMIGLSAASPNHEPQLRFLLAAVAVFLLSSEQCRYSAATIGTLTHPPRLIRVYFITGVAQDWLIKESVESTLTKNDFYTLVDCIETPESIEVFNAGHQATALSDEEWKNYLADLSDVRTSVRKENEQREWKRVRVPSG